MAAGDANLSAAGLWPIGSTVSVYARLDPNFVPVGPTLASAVVAGDHSLSYSGLTPGQRYIAAAQLGGSWVYVHFTADPLESDPATQGELDLVSNKLDNLAVANVKDYGAMGDGVTDDLAAFNAALTALEPTSGGVLQIPPGEYWLSGSLEIKNRGTLIQGSGVYRNAPFSPTSLVFAEDVDGVVFPTEAHSSRLEHILIKSDGGAEEKHGIIFNTPPQLVNVAVSGFGGNGVHIEATTPTANANQWYMERVWSQANGGHGFYVDGGDSQAGTAIACVALSNTGWGIYDSSSLGNTWIGSVCEGNTAGAHKTEGSLNASVFVCPYTETPQENDVNGLASLLWPTGSSNNVGNGAVIKSSTSGSSRVRIDRGLMVESEDGPRTNILGTGGSNIFMQFYPDKDESEHYRLKHDATGIAFSRNGAASETVLEFTTAGHSLGPHQLLCDNGIHIKGRRPPGAAATKFESGTGPPDAAGETQASNDGEPYQNGDKIFDVSPSAGEPVGWVRVGANDWRPFGIVLPQPTALTAEDESTVDAIYGQEEADVIENLRTRVNELEAKLQALELLA